MGMWRARQEESKSLWFRVPVSLKKEFEELRQQAEAAGLDAGATFTAALGRLAKQLREELPGTAAHAAREGRVNGVARNASDAGHRTSTAT